MRGRALTSLASAQDLYTPALPSQADHPAPPFGTHSTGALTLLFSTPQPESGPIHYGRWSSWPAPAPSSDPFTQSQASSPFPGRVLPSAPQLGRKPVHPSAVAASPSPTGSCVDVELFSASFPTSRTFRQRAVNIGTGKLECRSPQYTYIIRPRHDCQRKGIECNMPRVRVQCNVDRAYHLRDLERAAVRHSRIWSLQHAGIAVMPEPVSKTFLLRTPVKYSLPAHEYFPWSSVGVHLYDVQRLALMAYLRGATLARRACNHLLGYRYPSPLAVPARWGCFTS